jgi:hypothetical protein
MEGYYTPEDRSKKALILFMFLAKAEGPIPSATSTFLVFSGCLAPINNARDPVPIPLPLVSRRTLLSHDRWGNEMGKEMDFPHAWE